MTRATDPSPSSAVPSGNDGPHGRPGEGQASTEDTLRAKVFSLRPNTHVEAERLQNELAERMFGTSAEPTRIGRFTILGRLGSGGMGVVYSAYDPRLDRRVALKLLRDSGRVGRNERERLLREAHALARISHPNVVTVHEVGELADQVFVVMEFVVGQTLGQWVQTASRSTEEVLAAYRQAGRGLAAAHEAGLVHRDFKPHNAILGDDGRVRVVDFGLAQGESLRDSGEHLRPASPVDIETLVGSDGRLTRSSALLGTPAYMSPEQYDRRPLGPASDQFSFCVSLYQALLGEHPFAASTPAGMAGRIIAGKLREPRGHAKVPSWVMATVRRGLSLEPSDRFPSMDDLLAALGRDPAATRRRWGVGLAFAGLAGLSVYGLATQPEAVAPCQSSHEALATVWNEGRRAELREGFAALPTPDATPVGSRILDTLDGYAGRWQAMHHDACIAHHHGEQSGVMLDKRMACLSRRRAALDSAVSVLTDVDVPTFENAALMVHDLPSVHMCGDLEALEAELPVPDDPALAREVARVREELSQAATMAKGGYLDRAHTSVTRLLEHARSAQYPPLIAEALLARGRIEMDHPTGDYRIPSSTLLKAFHAGVSSNSDMVAAEALILRLYVEAVRPDGKPTNEQDLALARAFLDRAPSAVHLRALFLNNAGNAAAARGDYASARDYFRQALQTTQALPHSSPIGLLEMRFNLALMAQDESAQVTGLELAVEGFEREFGSSHHRTLTAKSILARAIRDPQAVERRFGELCSELEHAYPKKLDQLSNCLFEDATRMLDLGRTEAATDIFERLAGMLEKPMDSPLHTIRRGLARGYARLYNDRTVEAIAEFELPLERFKGDTAPQWLEMEIIALEIGLSEALLDASRPAEVLEMLLPAHELLVHTMTSRRVHFVERMLAQTNVLLARASLDATVTTRVDPRRHLDAAIAWYREGGPSYAHRLDQLEALGAQLDTPL